MQSILNLLGTPQLFKSIEYNRTVPHGLTLIHSASICIAIRVTLISIFRRNQTNFDESDWTEREQKKVCVCDEHQFSLNNRDPIKIASWIPLWARSMNIKFVHLLFPSPPLSRFFRPLRFQSHSQFSNFYLAHRTISFCIFLENKRKKNRKRKTKIENRK